MHGQQKTELHLCFAWQEELAQRPVLLPTSALTLHTTTDIPAAQGRIVPIVGELLLDDLL
jgi:hypothetical protein